MASLTVSSPPSAATRAPAWATASVSGGVGAVDAEGGVELAVVRFDREAHVVPEANACAATSR